MNTGQPTPESAPADFKANCKVAVGVDPDKFFRLLLPRLTTST
jgi:hypothetical protein